MGLNLRADRHRRALTSTATPQRLQRLHRQGAIVFTQLREAATAAYYPFGNVAVTGRDPREARTKLTAVCLALGLETREAMEDMVGDFVCP